MGSEYTHKYKNVLGLIYSTISLAWKYMSETFRN